MPIIAILKCMDCDTNFLKDDMSRTEFDKLSKEQQIDFQRNFEHPLCPKCNNDSIMEISGFSGNQMKEMLYQELVL